MAIELNNLGGQFNTMEKIESQTGKYKDVVAEADLEGKLPTEQLPKAPDPSPFKIKGA